MSKIIESNEINQYNKWLDLIEKCIERMANNSLQIKKWSIALVLAVIALIPESTIIAPKKIVFSVGIGIIAFWVLDSYYLMLERAFRDKYKIVIEYMAGTKKQEETTLNMKTERDFCMFLKAFVRPVEFIFYLILIGICIYAFFSF